jgi:hypothetical protein
MVEMKLKTAIATNANPARIVIAEGKVRTYDMSGRRGDTDSPWRGGKDSTLDVAKAIADYASS